ncbi:MAG: GTPase HflX [Paracoccaceae bacterium]
MLHPAVRGSVTSEEAEARLSEGMSLTRALDVELEGGEIIWLARPHPATLMGSGKVAEVAEVIHAGEIDLLVIDGTLSPVQQRNLERELKAKVLDRTGLILEIFGERAQTREGVLQVDLAHLSYQKSRLVRSWTHLERQRGGAGFMGGPGERQIESDRRQLDGRITSLRRQLDKVVKTRTLHRAARAKVPHPIVALVGYTNAGKSTLFNRLTEADVMAKDMLFATLDPTMREITLPSGRTAIMSDTVGFISDLPTQLVAAFRATLEEVLEADLLVHVRDISSPRTEAQARDVTQVLTGLGVQEDRMDGLIEAWNKTDLLDADAAVTIENRAERLDNTLMISAHDGSGCETLLAEIETRLFPARHVLDLTLPHAAGRAIAWLHAHGDVTARTDDGDGVHLNVELTDREYFQFRKQFPEAFPDAPPDRQAAE